MLAAVGQNGLDDAQIIPVSVFWGQSPDSESSPWKLLFADNWAVTGRLRKLARILILGRKTRVQFSAPIHLRELVEQGKGHERTLRMVNRILRVHFRNLKTAVIGPDLSHRRNLVKGPAARAAGTPGDQRGMRERTDIPGEGRRHRAALRQ